MISGLLVSETARSPSGKAKVCKTFIEGSIPSRASKLVVRRVPCSFSWVVS